MQERFSIAQVATLRRDLLASGLDSFQLAETIKMFFSTHGYGISPEVAREVATRLESTSTNVEFFHRKLETLALMA